MAQSRLSQIIVSIFVLLLLTPGSLFAHGITYNVEIEFDLSINRKILDYYDICVRENHYSSKCNTVSYEEWIVLKETFDYPNGMVDYIKKPMPENLSEEDQAFYKILPNKLYKENSGNVEVNALSPPTVSGHFESVDDLEKLLKRLDREFGGEGGIQAHFVWDKGVKDLKSFEIFNVKFSDGALLRRLPLEYSEYLATGNIPAVTIGSDYQAPVSQYSSRVIQIVQDMSNHGQPIENMSSGRFGHLNLRGTDYAEGKIGFENRTHDTPTGASIILKDSYGIAIKDLRLFTDAYKKGEFFKTSAHKISDFYLPPNSETEPDFPTWATWICQAIISNYDYPMTSENKTVFETCKLLDETEKEVFEREETRQKLGKKVHSYLMYAQIETALRWIAKIPVNKMKSPLKHQQFAKEIGAFLKKIHHAKDRDHSLQTFYMAHIATIEKLTTPFLEPIKGLVFKKECDHADYPFRKLPMQFFYPMRVWHEKNPFVDQGIKTRYPKNYQDKIRASIKQASKDYWKTLINTFCTLTEKEVNAELAATPLQNRSTSMSVNTSYARGKVIQKKLRIAIAKWADQTKLAELYLAFPPPYGPAPTLLKLENDCSTSSSLNPIKDLAATSHQIKSLLSTTPRTLWNSSTNLHTRSQSSSRNRLERSPEGNLDRAVSASRQNSSNLIRRFLPALIVTPEAASVSRTETEQPPQGQSNLLGHRPTRRSLSVPKRPTSTKPSASSVRKNKVKKPANKSMQSSLLDSSQESALNQSRTEIRPRSNLRLQSITNTSILGQSRNKVRAFQIPTEPSDTSGSPQRRPQAPVSGGTTQANSPQTRPVRAMNFGPVSQTFQTFPYYLAPTAPQTQMSIRTRKAQKRKSGNRSRSIAGKSF